MRATFLCFLWVNIIQEDNCLFKYSEIPHIQPFPLNSPPNFEVDQFPNADKAINMLLCMISSFYDQLCHRMSINCVMYFILDCRIKSSHRCCIFIIINSCSILLIKILICQIRSSSQPFIIHNPALMV